MTLFETSPTLPGYDMADDPFADDETAAHAELYATLYASTEEIKTMPNMTNHSSSETGKAQAAANVAAALAGLLDSATPAIDAEQVREIVREEAAGLGERLDGKLSEIVAAHLAAQPARRVVIEVGSYTSPETDGPLPINFYRVLKLMNARQNTALIGPSGCGKTHTAKLAADALGLRFASLSISAGMSEGALMGRLLPTGDGGKFEYAMSQFVDYYENGGVFLLDELDAADANTLLVINTALANGHLPLPSRNESPEAKRHPDFVCIACANTYGNGADRQYVGREQLDAATLDRFRAGIVTCDYDSFVEASLVDEEFLTWARAMRERITATKLRRFVSTRFLLDATRLLATKMATRASLLDSYFADWSADERAKVGTLCPAEAYDIVKDHAHEAK